jgi:hypothetical protein
MCFPSLHFCEKVSFEFGANSSSFIGAAVEYPYTKDKTTPEVRK